jgi:hypothetical protein
MMKKAIGFLLDIIAGAVVGAMLYVGLISGSVSGVTCLLVVLICITSIC